MTNSEQPIHKIWTETTKLLNYSGDFSLSDFLIILLGLEYSKSDATVVVSGGEFRAGIVFQKGSIINFYGFGNVISSIESAVSKGLHFGDFVGLAMSKGVSHENIMKMIQKNLAQSILGLDLSSITILSFEKPKIPMKLGISVFKLFEIGIEEQFLVQSPKRTFQKDISSKVFSQIPEGALPRLGLPPNALRMVRAISSNTTVGDIAESKNDWIMFYLLHLFGLLAIEPSEQSKSSQLSDSADSAAKKLAELQDWYNTHSSTPPHVLLEITQANELNSITISQKSRAVSSKLHPDRFVAYGEEVQTIAQRCFELVSAAEQKLEDEEYLKELKAQLDAEARGEVYVSESSEKKSHLLYEKAKFLFRRNKIDETRELVDQAYALNPYYWRLNYLRFQLLHKQKGMPDLEIAENLLKIDGCKGHERLDIICFAAELFQTSPELEHQNKAKEILKTIRTIDPEFQRAKILHRRLHKAEEAPVEAKEEKKGFFSSWFKR